MTQRSDQAAVGYGRITGTVHINGNPPLPKSAPLLLINRRTHRTIRTGRSDAEGNYQFDGIPAADRYIVIATDESGEYEAVIADQLVPELMR